MLYKLLTGFFLVIILFLSFGTAKAQAPALEVQQIESNIAIEQNNLLNKIALCESGNSATAKNASSTASGRFQFLKGTWEYYGKQLWGDDRKNRNVFDYNDNTELATYVLERYGVSDWESSRSCWG